MAFIRQGNQGYQMPNQLQSSGNELLGTGTMTGKKQETTSGQPGGWTNIQDYLGANAGDQTNINLAKQRTGEKITEGANKINEQVSNLTSLPTAQGYSQDQLQNILQTDNYDMAQQGLSQSQGMNALTALPTVDQEITGYAPIEEGVANVDPNKFSSVSSFIGDLAPSSPTYSSGQKAFDAMLLQGSPEFKTTFVPAMKQQYQDMYLNPLGEARTGRQGQRDQAQQGLTQAQQDWQAGIDSWLSNMGGALNSYYNRLRQMYPNSENTIQYSLGSNPTEQMENLQRAQQSAYPSFHRFNPPEYQGGYNTGVSAPEQDYLALRALQGLLGNYRDINSYNPNITYQGVPVNTTANNESDTPIGYTPYSGNMYDGFNNQPIYEPNYSVRVG